MYILWPIFFYPVLGICFNASKCFLRGTCFQNLYVTKPCLRKEDLVFCNYMHQRIPIKKVKNDESWSPTFRTCNWDDDIGEKTSKEIKWLNCRDERLRQKGMRSSNIFVKGMKLINRINTQKKKKKTHVCYLKIKLRKKIITNK